MEKKMYLVADKIKRVILSCETEVQLKNSVKLLDNFVKLFKEQEDIVFISKQLNSLAVFKMQSF